MRINLAFAELLAILHALEEYLNLIEEQTERSQNSAKHKLEAALWNLKPDDKDAKSEVRLLYQEYDHQIDFVIPYMLRGPFLISMWAAYELAVGETSELVRKKQGQGTSLADMDVRDFPGCAKEYYKQVIPFQLYTSTQPWERLTLLYALRNAMAHANGRLDLINTARYKKQARRIQDAISKKKVGVKDYSGFIIVSGDFLKETFTVVKDEVTALMDRYIDWARANTVTTTGHS
jgi:hypothetical protein